MTLNYFCVFLCLVCVCAAQVAVKDGAYVGLRVAISPDLPPENATHIVELVKSLLQSTSAALHDAIGLRIGSVRLHIPESWSGLEWDKENEAPWGEDHDFMVDNSPAFSPRALQYAGCGVQGRHITVPYSWLDDHHHYPEGKELAREWIKYRYGVFDENGFEGDPLYPPFYKVPGSDDLRVTECTNADVTYTFRDAAGEECSPVDFEGECLSYPDEDTIENVTSSLMYFHRNFTNMVTVCGGDGQHAHNVAALNKHNVLCRAKSISEILQKSPDFESKPAPGDNSSEIEFTFVQDQKPRVIFAWQNTAHLEKMDNLIKTFGARLLWGLPEGSKLGLFDFGLLETRKWLRPFSVLLSEDRNQYVTTDFHNPNQPCISCALKTALEVLKFDDTREDSTIVLLAANNPDEDPDLLKTLGDNPSFCMVVIGTADATEEGYQKILTASPCSTFKRLNEADESVDNFEVMLQELAKLVPPQVITKTETYRFTKTVKTGTLTHATPLVIPAQGIATSFSLWPVAKYSQLECSAGGDKVQVEKVELGNAGFFVVLAAESDIQCNWPYASMHDTATQVLMTSEEGRSVEGVTWVHDTSREETQQPVIVYARVTMGGMPVREARVEAVVTDANGRQFNMELYDDGRGDPDITRYDGIYSRYFVDIFEAGTYGVSVQASSQEVTSVGKNFTGRCCGSVEQTADGEITPSFQISFGGKFITKSAKPDSGYSPGRITDLRAHENSGDQYPLSWTAPGAEMDHGSASSYEVQARCDHKDCHETGRLPKWMRVLNATQLKPKEQGQPEMAILQILSESPVNLLTQITIRVVNKRLVFSELSNAVPIFIAEGIHTEITTVSPDVVKVTEITPKTIAIIVGCVIMVIFLVLVIASIIFLKPKKHRDKELVSTNNVEELKNIKIIPHGEGQPMRRVESFPVILYTHDQIRDYRKKSPETPLYTGVQKQWKSLNALDSRENTNSDASTANASDDNSLGEMKQSESSTHTPEPSRRLSRV